MPSIVPTSEQIQAFMTAPLDGPILMVNLLRFNADGGRESYLRYAELVGPHLERVGARVVFHGSGKTTLIGDDAWDEIAIVEYPSREAFLAMVGAADYQDAAQYRTRGLADSRLYCTQPGTLSAG